MSTKDLENEIYFYLTTIPNRYISFGEIKINVQQGGVSPNGRTRAQFTDLCRDMPSKFNNLKLSDDRNLLMFTTQSTATKNYLNIAEQYITNPAEYCQNNSEFSGNLFTLIDGTNTMLHIVCKNERKDLLKLIIDNFDFLTDLQNGDGQKLIDSLPPTTQGLEMKIMLLEYAHAKQLEGMFESSHQIRRYNTSLCDIASTVQRENAAAQLDVLDLRWRYKLLTTCLVASLLANVLFLF
jgi:hypothetical protein